MAKVSFKEFISTKQGKTIIIALISVLAVGLVVGLVVGVVGTTGSSSLEVASSAEIRARVATKYIVPDVECTSGTLLFNRSLTSAQMSEKENDEYIVKYEMVVSRINDEGTSVGYIITATCTDGVVFDPSLIQSPQGFTKPYYAESDTEMLYPVYVERVERNDTEIPYLVSLHFWYNEQIFVFSTGITTLNDTYYGVDILLKEIDALVL